MIASEPPQPPQKHARWFGLIGIVRAAAARSRCRGATSTPSTRSAPLHCSSKTASTPVGDSSRTPLASPPHAIGVWIRATERALPWPPAAGISARRHGIVFADRRRRAAGSDRPCAAIELGVDAVAAVSGRLGGITWATRASCSGRVPMWKSAPSGPAISVGEELAERLAGDPPHDLAHEVALGDGVVARRRARLPPRRLGGEQRRRLVPVVERPRP